MAEKGRCNAITGSGTRCKGVAIDSSGLCHAHHPDRAEQRRRHASKGGRRAGRGRPVAELAALRTENADIRGRLLGDELAPNVAAVAVQSLNTDARLIVAGLKAREQEEILERVEELEQLLERQKEDRRRGA
jgi:hypothetical protein